MIGRMLAMVDSRAWSFLLLVMLFGELGLSGCATIEQAISAPTMTPEPPGGTRVEPPKELEDFTMINQDGETVSLGDFAGQPALFYFGYTYCPDVCPLTLAEINLAIKALGERADDVQFVFVSVDGARDTPERLAQFLPQFNERIIGLTTTDETQLQRITGTFGVFYELDKVTETQAEYLVAHTSSTFLIDADGRLHTIFAYRTPPEKLAEGILVALDEG